MAGPTARVVVIGNGMVGSRFVEDLIGRDKDERFEVTVLGAEEYEPYNRVLLSELVAGKADVAMLALGEAILPRTTVRRGVTAAGVDRESRVVLGSDGTRHEYDLLVLATGSSARVPPIAGLSPLPRGVLPLRTLDDARGIIAATLNAHRAVVVGGGVLGLEVATGLAKRGLCVTVVHGAPHLMERQLDPVAAQVASDGLERLGIAQRLGIFTEEAHVEDGRVTGIRLADDEVLPADLVVLTAGTIPEAGLAREAGLEVQRGVVVGEDLATPQDPRVFAIGDCAQPPEGGTGLIAQGWDQARRLAIWLTSNPVPGGAHGAAPAGVVEEDVPEPREVPHAGGTDVVRLKAHGLDVITMGVCGPSRPAGDDQRVLQLSDPRNGRHLEIVVQDGRLVGATCIGAGSVGADLTAAYTRGTPVPADPAHLLLRPVQGVATQASSPTLMPDRTTVCSCNGVTKGAIVSCWRAGADTVGEIARGTKATTGCGGCKDVVGGLIEWLNSTDPDRRNQAHLVPGAPAGAQGLTVRGGAPVGAR
jgi:assimilatory nitrate reductase electron transfer subunit